MLSIVGWFLGTLRSRFEEASSSVSGFLFVPAAASFPLVGLEVLPPLRVEERVPAIAVDVVQ
jgi:hypothetical protein